MWRAALTGLRQHERTRAGIRAWPPLDKALVLEAVHQSNRHRVRDAQHASEQVDRLPWPQAEVDQRRARAEAAGVPIQNGIA